MASGRQALPKVKISRAVLKDAVVMLDRPIGDAYASLGMQLEMFKRPISVTADLSRISMGEVPVAVPGGKVRKRAAKTIKIVPVGPPIVTAKMVDFRERGYGRLKKYWKNITKEACDWWKKNKDKTGEKLIDGLALAVQTGVPPEWRIPGFLASIAVILIQIGLDNVC